MYEQALKAVGEIIQEYDRSVSFDYFVCVLIIIAEYLCSKTCMK